MESKSNSNYVITKCNNLQKRINVVKRILSVRGGSSWEKKVLFFERLRTFLVLLSEEGMEDLVSLGMGSNKIETDILSYTRHQLLEFSGVVSEYLDDVEKNLGWIEDSSAPEPPEVKVLPHLGEVVAERFSEVSQSNLCPQCHKEHSSSSEDTAENAVYLNNMHTVAQLPKWTVPDNEVLEIS